MLDEHNSQIRLFELLPGTKDDPLCGRLRTVNFNSEPEYDAVSYVWGDPEPRFTLELNGDEFLGIPRNLRNALIGLRLRRGSRTLWVDAICINQQDLRERGHQVKIMGDVFRKARLVRVWLDADVDPQSQAFRMASRLEGPSTDGLFVASDRRELRCMVCLGDFDPEFWKPLREIFENPYWERIWTQQEYFLARKLQLHLPRGTLAPEPLIRFNEALQRSARDPRGVSSLLPISYVGKYKKTLFVSQYAGFRALRKQNSQQPSFKSIPLIYLFLSSSELKAADSRDRVYGLMGIATDCGQNDIEPDYDMSLLLTYQQVMQHYIRQYQSIDFLCNYSIGHDHSLPSWLPSPTKGSYLEGEYLPECASDRPPALTPRSIEFHDDVLSVRGIKFDIIASSGVPKLSSQPILQWSKSLEAILCGKAKDSNWTEHEAVLRLLNSPGRITDEQYSYVFNRPKRTPEELRRSLSNLLEFVARRRSNLALRDLVRDGAPGESGFSEDLFQLVRLLVSTMKNATFVGTDGSRLGLCHPSCSLPGCQPRLGDEIWILFGCKLPMVLRPQPPQGLQSRYSRLYSVIGPAVFPGLIAEACQGLLPDGSPGPTYRGSPPEIINLI